jgi:hypothetical protein
VPNTLEVVENTGNTPTCQAVQKLMRESLDMTPSLLSKVGAEIALRITTHIAQLAILFFLFAMYLVDNSSNGDIWTVIMGLFSVNGLIALVVYAIKQYWWLIAAAILLYIASTLAESRMKTIFSEFYHGLLKRLRKIFDLTNESV